MTNQTATQEPPMDDPKTIDQFIRETPGLRITTSTATRKKDDDGWEHDAYRVQLTLQDRSMRLNYRKGIGHNGNPPQLDEILDAIRSDSSGADETFEDWCANYGYDTDSRRAEKTWKLCRRQAAEAKALLGDDRFEVLLDCEGL